MSAESRTLEFLQQHIRPAAELFPDVSSPETPSGDHEEPQSIIEPIECMTFAELMEHYKESLYVGPALETALACMLACSVSTHQGGDPLWIYLIAPPSSGKSTLCEAISAAREYCFPQSKFTGFHSGMKSGKSKKDLSLIPLVNGKTLVVKDFTTLLGMSDMMKDNIFGELRDLYDGSAAIHYRNGVSRSYDNIRFTIIAGVTDEIFAINNTALGERFLNVDMTDAFHGSKEHVARGLENITASIMESFGMSEEEDIAPDRLLKIKQVTYGFMQHLHKTWRHNPPPIIPMWFRDKVVSIAQFICRARAKVARDLRSGELARRPRAEVGLRLAGQFMKLAVNLAIVFGKSKLDKQIMNIIRMRARDTARGYSFDVLEALSHAELGLDRDQLVRMLRTGKATISRRLEDLHELGMICRVEVPNNSGARGRHRHLWRLTPEYAELWQDLQGRKD